LFPDGVYHHTFRVYDDEHDVLLCKDLEVHLLELSKFDVAVEAVHTPLERWCYFFKHGASLDLGALPATLDVPVIRKAVEVLMKISQEEIERHWAAERLRAQRDAADRLATARLLGQQEGELIGRIRLLQELLQQPVTPREELTQRPESDLVQLEATLQAQLRTGKPANGTPPTAKT
jgi:hypothetical protein